MPIWKITKENYLSLGKHGGKSETENTRPRIVSISVVMCNEPNYWLRCIELIPRTALIDRRLFIICFRCICLLSLRVPFWLIDAVRTIGSFHWSCKVSIDNFMNFKLIGVHFLITRVFQGVGTTPGFYWVRVRHYISPHGEAIRWIPLKKGCLKVDWIIGT